MLDYEHWSGADMNFLAILSIGLLVIVVILIASGSNLTFGALV